MQTEIEKLAARVSSNVYEATVQVYEDAERAGLVVGNAHHMAQQMAAAAQQLLLERHKMKQAGQSAPGGAAPPGSQFRHG